MVVSSERTGRVMTLPLWGPSPCPGAPTQLVPCLQGGRLWYVLLASFGGKGVGGRLGPGVASGPTGTVESLDDLPCGGL